VSDVFAAIADDTRREILVSLYAQPMTVNQVAEMFPISRPAISRHLRILRESGLVRVDVSGRQRWCHVQTDRLAEVERWLGLFTSPWTNRLDALATEVARTTRDRRTAAERSTSITTAHDTTARRKDTA
jgi:DNA-binding transcriptional ArsR family regulator